MRALIFIIVLALSSIALFADWNIDQKVFAEECIGGFGFGNSVSISGNFAIVGAPGNDYPLGAAYLYQKVNDGWIEINKLQVSDSTNVIGFGSSVYINEFYMIISANHGYNNSSGTAYIFYNDNENWIEVASLSASGSPSCDEYGCSVSITDDGEYAVVGARNDDEIGVGAGAAYLYKREGSQWNQHTKLMASDGNSLGGFGNSVFIRDDFVFISSGGIDYCGSIYVYENIGDIWEYNTTLNSSYSTPDLSFGSPISISGDYLITGSNTNYYGTAFIFKNNGLEWIEQEPITPSDSFEYDHFGRSVSISGNYIVVGALDCPDVGISASAYFFEKVDSQWIELNKLTIEDWGGFGCSVSISNNNAIVGANYDWGLTNSAGSAYLISNDLVSMNHEMISNLTNSSFKSYPNPFNPSTIIEFSIQNGSEVELSIFNIKGQKIKTLVQKELSKGSHSVLWKGDDEIGKPVSSGIYFYKLNINGKTEVVNKCLLLK